MKVKPERQADLRQVQASSGATAASWSSASSTCPAQAAPGLSDSHRPYDLRPYDPHRPYDPLHTRTTCTARTTRTTARRALILRSASSIPPGTEAGARPPAHRCEGPGAPRRGAPGARPPHRKARHIARIAGVDLPREKRLEIALTYIFGIGRTRSAADAWSRDRGQPSTLRVEGPRPTMTGAHACATTSNESTTRSRATCAARCRPTSGARSRSAATRASGTAAACPCTGPAHPHQRAQPQGSRRSTVAGKKKPKK